MKRPLFIRSRFGSEFREALFRVFGVFRSELFPS